MPTDDAPSLVGRASRLLVASTIEFDSLFEVRMPHRTTLQGRSSAAQREADRARYGFSPPWLVSRSTWENGLALVGTDGIRAQELAAQPVNVEGLLRWGYLRRDGDTLRLTHGARAALLLWPAVAREADERWTTRVGDRLPRALDAALSSAREPVWPFAPQLDFARGLRLPVPPGPVGLPEPDLARRLAWLVQHLTRAYEGAGGEAAPRVSLAVASTVLPELASGPIAVRDLPRLTGLSRPAVDAMVGWLSRHRLATPVDAGRGPHVALTEEGGRAHAGHRRILHATEASARARVGAETFDELSAAVDEALEAVESLRQALVPPPGTWRGLPPARTATEFVSVDPAHRLPAYPVVLHRGGFPDGA